MRLETIPPVENGLVNAIVETPRGSANKYNYLPEYDLFFLKKTLPLGMVFPFDFGFIPNTIGGDSDPLDVIVLMDEPGYPGCLVNCRLVGILEVSQTERNKTVIRNDRIIAVMEYSVSFAWLQKVSDIPQAMRDQIEQFFISTNAQVGKKFEVIRWSGSEVALEAIKKSMTADR